MADSAPAVVTQTSPSQDDVDLTDEQIQQLLLEAEGRLRGSDVQISQNSGFGLR